MKVNPMKHCFALPIVLIFLSLPAVVEATDCREWSNFSTNEEYLEPISFTPAALVSELNKSSYSNGLQISISENGSELWMDITRFPGDAAVVTATAAIMKVGRLVNHDFDILVLSDGESAIFQIVEPVAREIGCQFIWGREGGQNPIHLMRILMRNLQHYETGSFVSDGFTGHLLGDTTLAMDINNQILIPDWAMSALD